MADMSVDTEREILDRLVKIEVMLSNYFDRQSDHETRIRKLEDRPVVTPKHVYGGVTLACLLLGTIAAIISAILRGLTV